MLRTLTFTITFLAALLAGCATETQNSQVSSSAPALASSRISPTTQYVVNQVLPPMVVSAKSPSLVDMTAHADDVWDRIRMGFAVPNMNTATVVEQQAWFLSHPDFLQRAADRSSHYLYHVVEELEKRHMPTELALLPFIESAYNPMAYSRARASGMWQFIPSTGKNFNLKQDSWHDERRDVVASTDAALSYLDNLYQMYGDWTIALAAYNWGEGSVKRAIDRNTSEGKAIDYLSLSMPDETRNYYPRLQALKNIIANPAAFGITLPRVDNEPYFVAVATSRDIDVQTAAKLADMPVEDFRALNPSFNRPIINALASPSLLVPVDRAAGFQERLASNDTPMVNWTAYRIKRGERLDYVAAHYGMTLAALYEANNLSARDRIRPGTEILVAVHHGASDITAAPSPAMQVARLSTPLEAPAAAEEHGGIIRASYTPPAARFSPSVYTVRRGDTLASVAQRFRMTVADVKRLNGMRNTRLAAGETLKVAEGEKSVARR